MQTVKNISDIKFFLENWDMIDNSFNYTAKWSDLEIQRDFTSLPTFVADFNNCSVANLPVLVTEDRKMITNHVWPLIAKSRDKPHKVHKFFKQWGAQVEIDMPPITNQFNETWTYVWLPVSYTHLTMTTILLV